MNFKKPVIAAIVAIILMGLYAYDRQRIQSGRMEDIRSARLIPFDVVDATRLELSNNFGDFVLEKTDEENWQLLEPIEYPADNGQVKALIDNLHGAKLMEQFLAEDLLPYGLDKPLAELSITGVLDGEEITKQIQIGGSAGELSRVYVKYADVNNVIYTTGDWVRNQALKDARLLRDKSVLEFAKESIKSVTIERGTGTLKISPSEESITGWMLNDEVPVSDERFNRFLLTMETLQAVDLYDDPTTSMKNLGLEPGLVSIDFDFRNGEQNLIIGKKLPDAFWATSSLLKERSPKPVVGHIRDRFLREVFYTESDWQTQRVFWSPIDSYTALRAESGDKMTRVFAEDGKWIFEEYPGIAVRLEKLAELFVISTAIKGFQFEGRDYIAEQERQEFGIYDQSYRLIAELPDGSEEGLILGSLAESADFAYIKRIQDNSIWRVNPEDLKGIRFTRKDLQDKRIASGFTEEIAKCEVSFASGNKYLVEFESSAWKFRQSGAPSAIVPTQDVQSFFLGVENVEWSAGLAALNSDKKDAAFDYYDQSGNLVYYFHIYESDFDDLLIDTPEGPFLVAEEQLTGMLAGFQRLLQLAAQ